MVVASGTGSQSGIRGGWKRPVNSADAARYRCGRGLARTRRPLLARGWSLRGCRGRQTSAAVSNNLRGRRYFPSATRCRGRKRKHSSIVGTSASAIQGSARIAQEKFDTAIEIYRRNWRRKAMDRPHTEATDRRAKRGPSVNNASSYARANIFRREGEYWTTAYEGDRRKFASAAGCDSSRMLLGRPGENISAVEMFAAVAATPERACSKTVSAARLTSVTPEKNSMRAR